MLNLIAKSKIEVGDQMNVDLKGFGTFTATVHAMDDEAVLFIFDKIICRRPVNKTDTNVGGFKESSLNRWLQGTLLPAFPDEIRSDILELTIPTIGQITGWSDKWDREHLEPDNDAQLPLMKERKNRIAVDAEDDLSSYWLQNATASGFSSSSFAVVGGNGTTSCDNASNSDGVRPAFRLRKERFGGLVPQENGKNTVDSKNMKEALLSEIEKKTQEIESLKLEIEQLKRYEGYQEAANETKALMDSYIRAGFTVEQAFRMVMNLSVTIIGGMTK